MEGNAGAEKRILVFRDALLTLNVLLLQIRLATASSDSATRLVGSSSVGRPGVRRRHLPFCCSQENIRRILPTIRLGQRLRFTHQFCEADTAQWLLLFALLSLSLTKSIGIGFRCRR